MAIRYANVRRLGIDGRLPMHRLHSQLKRHIHRSIFGHNETVELLATVAFETARLHYDPDRVAAGRHNNLPADIRMVSEYKTNNSYFRINKRTPQFILATSHR